MPILTHAGKAGQYGGSKSDISWRACMSASSHTVQVASAGLILENSLTLCQYISYSSRKNPVSTALVQDYRRLKGAV